MPAKLTLQQAQQTFIDKGATPLFTEYHGVEYKYPFICCNQDKGCKNQHSMPLSKIKDRGDIPQCKRCTNKLKSQKAQISQKLFAYKQRTCFEKIIKPYFNECGLTLITVVYKDSHQKLEFKCKCGNLHFIRWYQCKRGQILRCKECQLKYSYLRGSENRNWNPNLTDEDRKKNSLKVRGTKGRHWTQNVLIQANFTCALCGKKGGKLVAHHLYNYADYPDKRFDEDNGVCICRSHHTEFHSKEFYGKGNNIPDQFQEYVFRFRI